MRRYIVIHQTDDGLTVVLITRNYRKAEVKAKKITNEDKCFFGYVCFYDKEIPNKYLK